MKLGLLVASENAYRHTHPHDSCFISIDWTNLCAMKSMTAWALGYKQSGRTCTSTGSSPGFSTIKSDICNGNERCKTPYQKKIITIFYLTQFNSDFSYCLVLNGFDFHYQYQPTTIQAAASSSVA